MGYNDHINKSAPDYTPNAAESKIANSAAQGQNGTPEPEQKRWIWFITGPTACGKTTIAQALADDLKFGFLEGDYVCLSNTRLSPPAVSLTNTNNQVPPQSQRRENVSRRAP